MPPREAAAVVTLEHLLKAFVDKAQAGPTTIVAYKQTLDSLLTFYGAQKPIAEITPELADNWRSAIAHAQKTITRLITSYLIAVEALGIASTSGSPMVAAIGHETPMGPIRSA